jgi:hypothetical protein
MTRFPVGVPGSPAPLATGCALGRLLVGSLFVGSLLAPVDARAEDAFAAAGTLYEQGARAQQRGDFARAARLFAKADELAPEPTALEAALQAATLANDAPFAMSLVERALERPLDSARAAVVRGVQDRFGRRAGKLRVDCGTCTVELDGAPFVASTSTWVTTGEHVVHGSDGVWSRTVTVEVPATGRRVALRPGGAAADSAHEDESDLGGEPSPDTAVTGVAGGTSRGLSPGWFGAGLALTALAGGGTLASGLQTLAIHDDFALTPTQTLADRGRAAETRTYVLGGVTGAFGLATILVGALAVDWGGPARLAATPIVAPVRGGGVVGLSGRF